MSEVYCLYSTEDGNPRYVGRTEDGTMKRLKQHRTYALEMAEGAVYDWIRGVYRKGFEVEAHVLQMNIIPAEFEFYERYWIAQFSDLLNVHDVVAPTPESTEIGRKITVSIKARLAAEGGHAAG